MRKLALALFSMVLALLLGECTTGPRFVTCDNDAMCHDADSRFHYCSDSHCVECVSNSQCNASELCRAGSCEPR
jgi:hypothetical protein